MYSYFKSEGLLTLHWVHNLDVLSYLTTASHLQRSWRYLVKCELHVLLNSNLQTDVCQYLIWFIWEMSLQCAFLLIHLISTHHKLYVQIIIFVERNKVLLYTSLWKNFLSTKTLHWLERLLWGYRATAKNVHKSIVNWILWIILLKITSRWVWNSIQ